jgi:hypothetical protein
MAITLQQFSIIAQKRGACVFDPALALSPYGMSLVKLLVGVMDCWMARELLHIIENTRFYLREPEILRLYDRSETGAGAWPDRQTILPVLQEWERLRLDSDPAGMKLFWIGDGPGESMLPQEIDSSAVWRFEALSSSLDNRLKSPDVLAWAFRDAVALSVTLPAALILTQLDGANDGAPAICHALECWGLAHEQVGEDDWLHLERDLLRQHLVMAGLAKLRWSGLRLAVLHLVAPNAAQVRTCNRGLDLLYEGEGNEPDEDVDTRPEADYWSGAKGFWYPL